MKIISYKKFSRRFHEKNWRNKRPNVCQFELTFNCGLHCRHCYANCYNKAEYIKKELHTKEVKLILDKVYETGVLWLCFTGGDPLTRSDFLELYTYAKNKGFIITIFTNAYSMNRIIVECLKDNPPFGIEITLNAVTQNLYEKIARVKGSYAMAMQGINFILKAGLPLKIKTDATKYNYRELPKIRTFVKGLGLKLNLNSFINGRLNRDLTPCNLRISPDEALSLNGKRRLLLTDCNFSRYAVRRTPYHKLFHCAIEGGDGLYIDPYGNLVPCICIRKPRANLIKEDIEEARKKVLDWVKVRYSSEDYECLRCSIRSNCYSCPGKALLETGDLQGRVSWFCNLAHLKHG